MTLEDWGERVLFGLGLDHLSLLAWHPTQPFFSYPLQMAAAVIIMVAIISRCKENISADEFSLLASSFVILEFIGK